MKCKICGSGTNRLFKEKLLNKYEVAYYRCSNCKFIQTEEPYWLPEAYSNAITSLDIGLLSRNQYYKPIISNIINALFNNTKKFIDFGGGYGVFVRVMRDAGFDYYRYDIYCENIFAKGFDVQEVTEKSGKYELLTAFEVFEHLENPLIEIQNMLRYSDSILFSTELTPKIDSEINDWWYLAPETGQHISFYSKESLNKIAETLGLKFYTNGTNLHLFTRKKINKLLFKILSVRKFSVLYQSFFKSNRSLLQSDFVAIKNALNK